MLNNSGKILISTCQEISIDKLMQTFKKEYKRIFLKSVISDNVEFVTTSQSIGGERIWFKCPGCKERVGKLYQRSDINIIACRKCLNLEYASRM